MIEAKEYKLLSHPHREQLTKDVQAYLNLNVGWRPEGAVAPIQSNPHCESQEFVQTMVRYQDSRSKWEGGPL